MIKLNKKVQYLYNNGCTDYGASVTQNLKIGLTIIMLTVLSDISRFHYLCLVISNISMSLQDGALIIIMTNPYFQHVCVCV